MLCVVYWLKPESSVFPSDTHHGDSRQRSTKEDSTDQGARLASYIIESCAGPSRLVGYGMHAPFTVQKVTKPSTTKKIGNIKNESLHNQVIRAMRKLCQQSGCLPTNMCLPLEVTSPPNAEHISASALSDVYRKQWGEHLVALKMLRIHVEHQEAVRKVSRSSLCDRNLLSRTFLGTG